LKSLDKLTDESLHVSAFPMIEAKQAHSKKKLLGVVLLLMLLQLAGGYVATVDVVPSYQPVKFGLAGLLHLLAFTIFGFVVYRMVIKSDSKRIFRALAASLVGIVLFFNLSLSVIFAEDDTRSRFMGLGGRDLEQDLNYQEFGKRLYVYEWSEIPDGHIGTEIKLQEGRSPFAHRIVMVREQLGEVVRLEETLRFNERFSPRTVLTYNLRTGEVWISSETVIINSSDE
jgi:hypothetical protein